MEDITCTVEEPKNSRFGAFCLFLTAWMLPSTVGYHFGWMNPAISSLQNVFNATYTSRYNVSMTTSTWLPLLTVSSSSLIMGAFVGGTSSNFILNFISCKKLVQISHMINIIGITITSAVGGLTGSYEAFIVGRFMSGFPCGVTYAVIPILIAELSAKKDEDFWQSITGVSMSFGLLVGPTLAHPKLLGSEERWPFAIAFCVVPSLLYLISSFKIPEPPYWLIRKGRKEDALVALKILRIGEVENEMKTMEEEMGNATETIGIREILRETQYRNQLFAVFVLFAHLMLTGLNNIVLYSDLVFREAGIDPDIAPFATIGIFVLQFVMACFASELIDVLGGWKVNIGSSLVIITMLILFTISQAKSHLAPTVMPYVAVGSVAVFMIAWSGGTNSATLALLGEVTTEPTRATCLAYGNIVLWITSWFVGFIPPYLQKALKAYSMILWLACTSILLFYIVMYIPNTKGKHVEEIQAKFKGKPKKIKESLQSNKVLEEKAL